MYTSRKQFGYVFFQIIERIYNKYCQQRMMIKVNNTNVLAQGCQPSYVIEIW